jgi:hypothetical protein
MSKLINTLAAIVVVFGSASFAQDNDLFSEVRPDSVFERSPAKTPGSGSKTSFPKRMTRAEEVRDLLKSAGFEAKVAGSRTIITQKELDPWKFPVMVVLSEDEESVSIIVGLSTIKDVSRELPAQMLLKMLEACQENAPALFAYHAKRQRTELSVVLRNQDLTGLELRNEINRLAILAKNTDQIWTISTKKTAAPRTNLVGRWSADRSANESFGVEFASDGTFVLLYLRNGQQTRSTGTFTADGGRLSLVGADGSKLEGRLTIDSSAQFRLAIQNSKTLVFRRIS